MASKKKIEPDDKAQSARFVEAAKKIGADESGASFERAMKSLVPKTAKKKRRSI